MSTGVRFLLDVNVLVALSFPDHPSNSAARSWFRREPDRLWATCSIVQSGFVRTSTFLLGGNRGDVQKSLAILEAQCRRAAHEFWFVDTNLLDLTGSERSRLIGPRQITDMQLLMLAYYRGGQLATFDKGIRELAVGTRFANSLLVL